MKDLPMNLHPKTRTEHGVLALRIAGAVLFALVCAGWAFSDARWWGVHHLAFLPPILSVVLLACAGVMLFPIGGKIVERFQNAFAGAAKVNRYVWVAVALIVFVVLHVREPLWGDAQLLLDHLVTLGRLESRFIPSVDKGSVHWTEPGENLLHENVFRLVAQFHPPAEGEAQADPEDDAVRGEQAWFFEAARWTYIGLSALAGALLVLLGVRFARKMLPPESRPVLLLTMLSASGMLLFCGYVEDYSWTALAVCACMLFALEESAESTRWPIKTLIVYGMAVAFHLMSLLFLPAIILLVVTKQSREGSPIRRVVYSRWFVPAFAGLCALGYVLVFFGPGLHYLISPFAADSKDGYSFFSGRHLADVGNLVLLCAALPCAALLGKAESRKQKTETEPPLVPPYSKGGESAPPDPPAGGGESLGTRRGGERVLQVAAVCGLAFVMFMNPGLGAARDWDLFSVVFWPLIVLAAWKLSRVTTARRSELLAIIAGFALLIPIPYLLVNARTQSELARCESVLRLDPTRAAAYGWESMAAYYRRQGDDENTLRTLKYCVQVDANPRYRLKLAGELRRMGRLDEAEPLYLEAARARPDKDAKYLLFLLQSYAKRGQRDKLLPLARTMVELQPDDPVFTKLLKDLERTSGPTNP